MHRHLLLPLLSLAVPMTIQAATFRAHCDNNFEVSAQACTIEMTGPIEQGDADRLLAVLKQRLPNGWRYGSVLLDSSGGSVRAALELATVVRQALLNTTTFRTPKDALDPKRRGDPPKISRKCISACFLVWVAGAERSTFTFANRPGDTPDIGLHRPYLDKAAYQGTPQQIASAQQQIMQSVADYLKREQVPQVVIEKMLQQASTQVYWLSDNDPDLTGRAPWFDEMMIARCKYDPTYDAETQAWSMAAGQEHFKREYAKGRRNIDPIDLGERYKKYLEWRQRYNYCEYGIRETAQEALRK